MLPRRAKRECEHVTGRQKAQAARRGVARAAARQRRCRDRVIPTGAGARFRFRAAPDAACASAQRRNLSWVCCPAMRSHEEGFLRYIARPHNTRERRRRAIPVGRTEWHERRRCARAWRTRRKRAAAVGMTANRKRKGKMRREKRDSCTRGRGIAADASFRPERARGFVFVPRWVPHARPRSGGMSPGFAARRCVHTKRDSSATSRARTIRGKGQDARFRSEGRQGKGASAQAAVGLTPTLECSCMAGSMVHSAATMEFHRSFH